MTPQQPTWPAPPPGARPASTCRPRRSAPASWAPPVSAPTPARPRHAADPAGVLSAAHRRRRSAERRLGPGLGRGRRLRAVHPAPRRSELGSAAADRAAGPSGRATRPQSYPPQYPPPATPGYPRHPTRRPAKRRRPIRVRRRPPTIRPPARAARLLFSRGGRLKALAIGGLAALAVIAAIVGALLSRPGKVQLGKGEVVQPGYDPGGPPPEPDPAKPRPIRKSRRRPERRR